MKPSLVPGIYILINGLGECYDLNVNSLMQSQIMVLKYSFESVWIINALVELF